MAVLAQILNTFERPTGFWAWARFYDESTTTDIVTKLFRFTNEADYLSRRIAVRNKAIANIEAELGQELVDGQGIINALDKYFLVNSNTSLSNNQYINNRDNFVYPYRSF